MSENTPNSIRALLSELIDYAGLFPPAGLSMPEAVINYATYHNSNYNWMLGRFVLPVEGLDEFLENSGDFFPGNAKGVWKLSVLAGDDIQETIRKIKDFNNSHASYVVCDALEIKAETAAQIEAAAEAIPDFLAAYFEIPINENLADLVTTLAIYQQRAKIRTGGTNQKAFPSVEQITRFMRTCLAANVPFKATAGLHHPIRCQKPLTYEKNAPTGMMHGFLNVFLAAGFLRQSFNPGLVQELLKDAWAENFTFDENGILWRQEYFLSTVQLEEMRQKNAISFGSCSFVEPIADLQEIGLL
jgi:hypothetical protein